MVSVHVQTLSAIALSMAAVLTFLVAVLSRLKKMWTEAAKQTWLLKDVSKKLNDHIDVTHREQARRITALERRRSGS